MSPLLSDIILIEFKDHPVMIEVINQLDFFFFFQIFILFIIILFVLVTILKRKFDIHTLKFKS
jgi:hypothetical protein